MGRLLGGICRLRVPFRTSGSYHAAHYELGDGYLESVCQRALAIALRDADLEFVCNAPFDVFFRGQRVGRFYADLVVQGLVLVEVKSCPRLEERHRAQVINYLRCSTLEVALLVNFGPRREFQRLVYGNERKLPRDTQNALDEQE